MLELFLSLFSSLLRIEKRPIMTFFLRTIIIALGFGFVLAVTTSDKSKIINNLDWFLGCSFVVGAFVSFIAGISEYGRENVEKVNEEK